MQRINTTDELRAEIQLLKIKQAQQRMQLNEQLHLTYESLKPANLIKKTLSDMAHSPELKNGLLNGVISMAAGYISKRVVVGSSPGPIKGILGNALQMLVTKFVAKKAKDRTDSAKEKEDEEENERALENLEKNNEYTYDQ